MTKEDIELRIRNFIKEKLDVDITEKHTEYTNISLLSPEIGLKPRDLLVIFFEMEQIFNIHFLEEDITKKRFDILSDMVDSIYEKIKEK